MREESEQTFTGDTNKKKVILIQSGFTKIPQAQRHPQIPQQLLDESLKQNANINKPLFPPQECSKIHSTPLPSSAKTRMEDLKPQPPALNFDMIMTSLFHLTQEVRVLSSRIEYLEKKMGDGSVKEESDIHSGNKKRRRKAQEIIKNYFCTVGNCHKGYGSEMSLNLHMKLKHLKEVETKSDAEDQSPKEMSNTSELKAESESLVQKNSVGSSAKGDHVEIELLAEKPSP